MSAEDLDCPVLHEIQALQQQLQSGIQDLHASRRSCRRCPRAAGCPGKILLAQAVSQAVSEVLKELEG